MTKPKSTILGVGPTDEGNSVGPKADPRYPDNEVALAFLRNPGSQALAWKIAAAAFRGYAERMDAGKVDLAETLEIFGVVEAFDYYCPDPSRRRETREAAAARSRVWAKLQARGFFLRPDGRWDRVSH